MAWCTRMRGADSSGPRARTLRRRADLQVGRLSRPEGLHSIDGERSIALTLALLLAAAVLFSAATASAQAVGGAEKARPVAGDPGISSMLVMEQAEFRVLRDYAEPGATRRMHSHDDATWHVFTLVTGQLLLTVDGEAPVEVAQGQVLNLKGGAKHTFRNTGTVTATIVEVFGKAAKP
jgi:quercetin dioxygenase-like cupin family protein